MNRHATFVIVEHGDELEAGVERVKVLAEGRDAYVVGVFTLGDGPLGDVETAGATWREDTSTVAVLTLNPALLNTSAAASTESTVRPH